MKNQQCNGVLYEESITNEDGAELIARCPICGKTYLYWGWDAINDFRKSKITCEGRENETMQTWNN